MDNESDLISITLLNEKSKYVLTREMSPYSDRLAIMFGTFSDLLLAAGFKSDPRYVDMVDHWNNLNAICDSECDFEPYAWDLDGPRPWEDEFVPEATCGSGDHASVDTVYPKPAEPDVTGGFLAGDIVKVTSDAYVDSGRVLNMVGKVARFSEEYARLNRQSVLVHFKEHSDMLFWLDPRALTLIYRA